MVKVNSVTKTVINFKYDLDKYFQEILHKIDNWIKSGSGWIIQSIDAEHVHISAYSLSSGSTYHL